jgi:hypothetical protein
MSIPHNSLCHVPNDFANFIYISIFSEDLYSLINWCCLGNLINFDIIANVNFIDFFTKSLDLIFEPARISFILEAGYQNPQFLESAEKAPGGAIPKAASFKSNEA